MWDMPYKARSESVLIKTLRILNKRTKLTGDDKRYLLNLEKGFHGEVQFDLLTEKLQRSCYILNDLQLESNKSDFQLDSSLIFQETYYLFDIKNFEGEYCYDPEYFKSPAGRDIQNPLDQLKRSKLLLSQLFHSLGSKLTIEALIIFINPQFILFQTPQNLPFILPTQLDQFMKKLDKKSSRLNQSHKNLADKLISLHKLVPPKIQLPTYTYEKMQKGLTCCKCDSFSVTISGKKLICGTCGCTELVTSAVLRNVEEFRLLFPEVKVTTNIIFEWCEMAGSRKRVSRILGKNLKITGLGQWAFYE
jgi:hypothetical protein